MKSDLVAMNQFASSKIRRSHPVTQKLDIFFDITIQIRHAGHHTTAGRHVRQAEGLHWLGSDTDTDGASFLWCKPPERACEHVSKYRKAHKACVALTAELEDSRVADI